MDYYLFTLELREEHDSPWTMVTIFKQYLQGECIDSHAIMFELVDLFNSAFEVKPSVYKNWNLTRLSLNHGIYTNGTGERGLRWKRTF